MIQYCEPTASDEGRMTAELGDRAASVLTRPDLRTSLIAEDRVDDCRERYLLDGRELVARRPSGDEIPTAFVLDGSRSFGRSRTPTPRFWPTTWRWIRTGVSWRATSNNASNGLRESGLPEAAAHAKAADLELQYDAHGQRDPDTVRLVDPPVAVEALQPVGVLDALGP